MEQYKRATDKLDNIQNRPLSEEERILIRMQRDIQELKEEVEKLKQKQNGQS